MIIKALKTFSDGVISMHEGEIAKVPDAKAQTFIAEGYAMEYSEPISEADLKDYVKGEDLPDYVTPQQFGAKGDGITNDSQAFIDAIASGSDTIIIPKGSYNLNHAAMELPRYISFIGENASTTKILNSKIIAPNGILVKNVTFDGGSTRWIPDTEKYGGGFNSALNGKNMILDVTPTAENVSVEYYSCIFENADLGSMAYRGNGATNDYPIAKNIIKDCIFRNINYCGVFHWLDVIEGVYTDNIFKNIGNEDVLDGGKRVVALALGDTSNITTHDIDKCIIENNTFDTLISGYDYSGESHKVAVNFITVQAEKVTIINNRFKNLLGYGEDREGVYTKAHYAEIANNLLEDCGSGEGYLCCKPRANVSYTDKIANIHDNTFKGEFGRGIAIYNAAKVYNNLIKINKMKSAIVGFAYNSDKNGLGTCEIIHNRIAGGVGNLVLENEVVSSYTPSDIIALQMFPYGVFIKDNNISIEREDGTSVTIPSIIKVGSLISNTFIEDNVIDAYAGTGVQVSTSSSDTPATSVTDVTININNNVMTTQKSQCILATLTNLTVGKEVNIKNNVFKGLTNGNNGVYVSLADDNADTLDYETQLAQNVFNSKHIITNAKTVKSNRLAYITTNNANVVAISTDYMSREEVEAYVQSVINNNATS